MVRSRTDATKPATALRGVTASSACAAVLLLLLLLPPAADAFVDVVVVAGAAVPSSSGWWALDRHATLPPVSVCPDARHETCADADAPLAACSSASSAASPPLCGHEVQAGLSELEGGLRRRATLLGLDQGRRSERRANANKRALERKRTRTRRRGRTSGRARERADRDGNARERDAGERAA